VTALAVMVAALLGPAAQQAFAGSVITNGTVALGVNDLAQLNFSDATRFVGVTYEATGNDGTRAGCQCEGWGAGANDGANFSGYVDNAITGPGGVNLDLVSFVSTASTATSVATIDAKLRVTHVFAPSPSTPNLYEIKVTIENISGGPLTDVRYTRLMDWDVEPTAFDEFVTIQRGSTPAPAGDLIHSNDNGFENPDPFDTHDPLDPATENADYTDKGPDDHGALFDFGFGPLAAGAKKEFSIFYGAAGTEAAANAAISAAALELYSLGQPNGGQVTGEPNTFIWGFKAVGGAPVIPPTLTLSPKTATNPTGTPHTVTAELKSSAGTPVPGASIVFEVTGVNPQPAATRTTGADGKATFTYTGTTAGDDAIKACLDNSGNGACDTGEVTDTAAKTWTGGGGGPPPDTTKPSCVLTAIGTDSIGRKFIEVTAQDTGSGLATIQVTTSINADTVVPPFTPGTTSPVVVRGTKINQSSGATVELEVTDVAGNVTRCDPVLARLVVRGRGQISGTYRGLPRAESIVRIENSAPGVRRVEVIVNGRKWMLTGLKAHAVRTIDVAAAMRPGKHNTITVRALGKAGQSVVVVISDSRADRSSAAPSRLTRALFHDPDGFSF
jgi:Big-like domain-containing protein